MRSALLLVALLFCAPARAQFDASDSAADWMLRGFEAAVADPAATKAVIADQIFIGLAGFVPADRAGTVIDNLTPLLGDPEQKVRAAAAEALAGSRPATGRAP